MEALLFTCYAENTEYPRMTMTPRQTKTAQIIALLSLALSVGLFFQACPQAAAAGATDVDKSLSVLENRYFFHHYGHDPVEKRLERIELLILGDTRSGTAEARIQNIQKAVQLRDSQAAKIMREGQAQTQGAGNGAAADKNLGNKNSAPGNSSSYPAVGTIEWRVLKKTYPQESLDQRLNRLETNLFGVPAQAMSYVDRIERLKKTTGIDVVLSPSDAIKPGAKYGPLPRSLGQGFGFEAPSAGGFESIPGGMPGGLPENSRLPGSSGEYRAPGTVFRWNYSTNIPNNFGSGQDNSGQLIPPGFGQIPGQPRGLGELVESLNRQMMEMMKHMNGVEEMPLPINPERGPSLVVPPEAKKGAPRSGAATPKVPAQSEELPPYSDPNSI